MAPRTSSDLARDVGQLLIMGFDGAEPSQKLAVAMASLQPAGVILFTRNIVSAEQTYELLRACQQPVEIPMFLCVDMEGGTVDRLRDAVGPAPSVEDVARSGDKKLFRKHGRIIGEEVRALGFNTDFAPVLDLGFAASRKVLGSRTVSVDPKATITYAREFLRGLRDARVLGCGKHFPGLGEADLDTHKELPQVLKPWKRLWAEDLLPYRELRREMAFVMVAHAAYPAVSRDGAPASLSKKWIGDILRKKIGYTGLVVSDDLEMGGVMAAASIEDAAIETIRAGADMFLVCHNEEHVWRTHKAVLRQAERDRRFAARVHQAAARVLSFKKKSRELKHRPPQPSATTLKKLSRELWELGEQVRLEAL